MNEEQTGVTNFRDFGGYASSFGGTVKTGQLFRSGQLARLSDAQKKSLLDYDFRVIGDLRYAVEREREASPWPEHYADRIQAHNANRDESAPHVALLTNPDAAPEDIDAFYKELNTTLPHNPVYHKLFVSVMNRMAEEGGPALVHCTAGKDRTGIMVALIQHLLGVSREDMREDFMRSVNSKRLLATAPLIQNAIHRDFGHKPSLEMVERLLLVREEYIDWALDSILEAHGSIDDYLVAGGLDANATDRLRTHYID